MPQIGIRPFGKRSHLLGNFKVRKRRGKKIVPIPVPNPLGKPVRNSKHPVQVLFVCSMGMSSGATKKHFAEHLQNKKAGYIHPRFLAVDDIAQFTADSRDIHLKQNVSSTLRRRLANTDIVVYLRDYNSTIHDKLAIFFPRATDIVFSEILHPHFEPLFDTIHKRFFIRNSRFSQGSESQL